MAFGDQPQYTTKEYPDGSVAVWDPVNGVNVRWIQGPTHPRDVPSNWVIEERADGTYRVNRVTGDVEKLNLPGQPTAANQPKALGTMQNPMDGSTWSTDPITQEPVKQLSPPIPGWVPGRGVPAPVQAPLGRQLTPAELQLQELEVQKAQRDLQDPMLLALQQRAATIKFIQEQIASGQLSPEDGNKLLGLSQANLDAALKGTTPWQMEESKRSAKQRQETLAQNVLGNQLSAGTGMASSLLSGASNIYSKILGSTGAPTNFDPLLLSKQYVQDMGGGPEMTQLAKAILTGALRSQGQGGF